MICFVLYRLGDPSTVANYGQAVTTCSRWLEQQGRRPALEELTRSAIRERLVELNEAHEPGTAKTRYRGLLRFLRLVDEG